MIRKELRVALIGQGSMGRAHSNAYAQVGHFFDTPFSIRRQVICGRNAETLGGMAARWGWEETATDWRQVIDRPDIDIVDVATPNTMHAEMAIAAARAGKIVFCEKPLAVSVEEAERMVEAARRVPNMVWFNYRRVPAIAYTRRLIEEDRIGRVFHYRAAYLQEWGNDPKRPPNWKMYRATAGSGVLGDLLSHLVDTALYLNGPIAEVSALQHTFAEGRDIDDATLLLARFANGSVGTFEATRYAVGRRNSNCFEIHGARGMARFDLEDLNRLDFHDATEPAATAGARRLLVTGPDQPYAGVFWRPGHIIGYEHTFIAALGDFLAALADGREFHPGFDDGLAVERVLDAVARSAVSRAWTQVPAGSPISPPVPKFT
ncbi:MAG: Gfo/Idh/MocA family oxidoreductase [Acidobacteria bacterium]|nr:Gfo/Idh/MocA family oxidoreductase [Acidobacteriota bacterium]